MRLRAPRDAGSLAGTGIWLSDGATTLMPVGPHRGDRLTPGQESENGRPCTGRGNATTTTCAARSCTLSTRAGTSIPPAPDALRRGVRVLPREPRGAALRLRSFVDKAAQATLVGSIFDDAATGQGLLNYFLLGLTAGRSRRRKLWKPG